MDQPPPLGKNSFFLVAFRRFRYRGPFIDRFQTPFSILRRLCLSYRAILLFSREQLPRQSNETEEEFLIFNLFPSWTFGKDLYSELRKI